jgi:hypothetical protein
MAVPLAGGHTRHASLADHAASSAEFLSGRANLPTVSPTLTTRIQLSADQSRGDRCRVKTSSNSKPQKERLQAHRRNRDPTSRLSWIVRSRSSRTSSIWLESDFLFEQYASTRAAELDHTGWDETTTLGFLRLQFSAQSAHYAKHFSAAGGILLAAFMPAWDSPKSRATTSTSGCDTTRARQWLERRRSDC